MTFLRLINWNPILGVLRRDCPLKMKPPWGKQCPAVKSASSTSDWGLFLHFSWILGQTTIFQIRILHERVQGLHPRCKGS